MQKKLSESHCKELGNPAGFSFQASLWRTTAGARFAACHRAMAAQVDQQSIAAVIQDAPEVNPFPDSICSWARTAREPYCAWDFELLRDVPPSRWLTKMLIT